MAIVKPVLILSALVAVAQLSPAVRRVERAVPRLPAVSAAIAYLRDAADRRPEVSILFIGNSGIFANDLPDMVRRIADAAGSPRKFHTVMYALPGRTMREHWDDPDVRALLHQSWHFVVLQTSAGEQLTPAQEASFQTYGAALVAEAKSHGAVPVLLVAWRGSDPAPREFQTRIQESYAHLANGTGAAEVNAGKVWDKLMTESAVPLLAGGFQPTIQGSYLTALMLYRFLGGGDPRDVPYVPAGLPDTDATVLRSAALEP